MSPPESVSALLRANYVPVAKSLVGALVDLLVTARPVVGGVAGFGLAFGATAGPIATAGFGLLAPIWIYTTVQGWLTARAGRFEEHRRWMIRSFALTFAAVTLRLYLPLGVMAGLSFQQIYVATAWISWVPNLLLVELWLQRGRVRLQPA